MFQKEIQSADSLIGDPVLDAEGAIRNSQLADVLVSAPGPDAMAKLLLIDKSTLGPTDRIDLLTCWQRQVSWVSSQEQEATLYVAGTQYLEKAGEFDVDCAQREDVASALRMSPHTAQNRIDVARTLFNHLPQTISALSAGEIAPQHATVIAQETAAAVRAGLDQIAISEIEKIALAHAEFHTPTQVANKLRNTFASIAPQLFQKSFDDNRAARNVRFFKEKDGVGTILASLKIEDAQMVDQVISDYSENILAQHRETMRKLVRFSSGHNCVKNCQSNYLAEHNSYERFSDTAGKLIGELKPDSSLMASLTKQISKLQFQLQDSQLTQIQNEKINNQIEKLESKLKGISNSAFSCAHACSDSCKDACLELNSNDAAALAALERANLINSDFEKDMRRADAFVFAMKAADAALKATGSVVTRHNRRPTINVTIDLPTALGLAENPGQLAGYGPIPASVARQIAADGRWKRFVTDPITGTLIDYGRESYEPPQDLQDFLIARDRTCRFPGCRQPAHLSDLDHAIPWDEGGTTSAENLGALCRRHHNLKTHHNWQLINLSDGACKWISPTGHEYFVPARPIMDTV